MEIWDIYDKNRKLTGKTHTRGEKLSEGEYHMVVHVCIFNSKDEMLIQQRQPFKQGWSNLWDVTVGGASHTGENSSQAAERELEEEIGFKADLSNLRPCLTMNFERGFDDWYLIDREVDLNTLKLQYEEVQDVKWATLDEIIELIDNGSFIPYNKDFIKLIFFLRHNKSAILA